MKEGRLGHPEYAHGEREGTKNNPKGCETSSVGTGSLEDMII